MLAALVAVYVVLGVLYESFIHPLTILSTLPSAGVGALLALDLTGHDLDIIGIIGIILLIGIVKKNAIMMIDFALAAERGEGKPPREAIFQACLLRFRPILMTTMAALLGALPLMLGTRLGLGAAPAARHRHRRRPAGQPGADPVHHAGDLPGVRPARGAADRAAGRTGPAPATRHAGRHEHLRPLHPPADRDHAADPGDPRRRRAGLLPAAGRLAAGSRFPDHLGAGAAAGRRSRRRSPPASRARWNAISARSPT